MPYSDDIPTLTETLLQANMTIERLMKNHIEMVNALSKINQSDDLIDIHDFSKGALDSIVMTSDEWAIIYGNPSEEMDESKDNPHIIQEELE